MILIIFPMEDFFFTFMGSEQMIGNSQKLTWIKTIICEVLDFSEADKAEVSDWKHLYTSDMIWNAGTLQSQAVPGVHWCVELL